MGKKLIQFCLSRTYLFTKLATTEGWASYLCTKNPPGKKPKLKIPHLHYIICTFGCALVEWKPDSQYFCLACLYHLNKICIKFSITSTVPAGSAICLILCVCRPQPTFKHTVLPCVWNSTFGIDLKMCRPGRTTRFSVQKKRHFFSKEEKKKNPTHRMWSHWCWITLCWEKTFSSIL